MLKEQCYQINEPHGKQNGCFTLKSSRQLRQRFNRKLEANELTKLLSQISAGFWLCPLRFLTLNGPGIFRAYNRLCGAPGVQSSLC